MIKKITFFSFLLISFQFLLNKVSNSTIEIRDTGIHRRFVEDHRLTTNRGEFTEVTGINFNTERWDTCKKQLGPFPRAEGRVRELPLGAPIGAIAGEVVAKLFFESLGYQPLEAYYTNRIELLKAATNDRVFTNIFTTIGCDARKGHDNGISGIFIRANEDFANPTHIIVNEAKCRDETDLIVDDFGFVQRVQVIQQSHSSWNREYFDQINWGIEGVRYSYNDYPIIRTATLFDGNGMLKLYEVKDSLEGEPRDLEERIASSYPSEAPRLFSIRTIYDLFFKPRIGE